MKIKRSSDHRGPKYVYPVLVLSSTHYLHKHTHTLFLLLLCASINKGLCLQAYGVKTPFLIDKISQGPEQMFMEGEFHFSFPYFHKPMKICLWTILPHSHPSPIGPFKCRTVCIICRIDGKLDITSWMSVITYNLEICKHARDWSENCVDIIFEKCLDPCDRCCLLFLFLLLPLFVLLLLLIITIIITIIIIIRIQKEGR